MMAVGVAILAIGVWRTGVKRPDEANLQGGPPADPASGRLRRGGPRGSENHTLLDPDALRPRPPPSSELLRELTTTPPLSFTRMTGAKLSGVSELPECGSDVRVQFRSDLSGTVRMRQLGP
jgi:hypothetical protein